MPFTASHPAAILPLAYLPRKYVCLTGLIVGSMTPDFEYFFRMIAKSAYSHTATGLFYFCLPVGLLLCFIFHNIIRDSLIDNLPLFLKARFYRIRRFDWNRHFAKRWFVSIPSILVGAWAHLFWDSFTHGPLRGYQHPSTLVGAIVLFIAIWKLPRDGAAPGGVSVRYWALFASLFALVMSICFMAGLRLDVDAAFRVLTGQRIAPDLYNSVSRVVICAMSASLISITVTSIVRKIFYRRKKKCY